MYKSHVRPSRAFTLVELIVVIGVIAILIAILLPTLGAARRSANSTACLANLRGIGQSLLIYINDNNGYLPGSPSSSGRCLWSDTSGTFQMNPAITSSNVPGPAIELFDYIGPLCDTNNFLALPPTSDPIPRLQKYRELPQFHCPANDYLASKISGPASLSDGPMLSYATATAFLLLPAKTATTTNTTFAGYVTMPTGGSQTDPTKWNYWSTPPGYTPKLCRVGLASSKIYLADAARRMRANGSPQFVYAPGSDYTDTLFSDFGPFYGITRSYDRSVPNNLNSPTSDPREFAYRHGQRTNYKMNALYFDGHAQTLTDMESADPNLWLPKGSTIYKPTQKLNATDYVFWPDVAAKYLPNTTATNPYVVP